ncbi:MAG: hypothetical protein QGD89_01915 [Actinomycetota bacterium]|nr:hypothetical protein [Actinomycetota bacterium]
MLPIRLIETERDDFDGPIAELWRDDDFIGMVFWDGEAPIVQIYPDADGDVQDLDVRELQRLLDTAVQIIDPHAFDEDLTELRDAVAAAGEDFSDVHPATAELLSEFDERAVHRTEDGEGFFKRADAEAFITKCEELDLAVVEMEGFDLRDATLIPRPKLDLVVTPQTMMSWSEFRTYANVTCHDTLRGWPSRPSIVIAFVIQQPDAETIVA